MIDILLGFLGLALGVAGGLGIAYLRARIHHASSRARAEQIVKEGERERERLLRVAEMDGKEKLLRLQEEHEREVKKQREELGALEKRLRQRETNIERRNEASEQRERDIKRKEGLSKEGEQRAQQELLNAQATVQEAARELERVAALSREQAREELTRAIEEDARRQAAGRIKRIEEEARREADERGKRIVAADSAFCRWLRGRKDRIRRRAARRRDEGPHHWP